MASKKHLASQREEEERKGFAVAVAKAVILREHRTVKLPAVEDRMAHIFMEGDDLIVAVEKEGCARVSSEVLKADNYEDFCIYLINEGFMTPVLEIVASGIFMAVSDLRQCINLLPPSPELIALPSQESNEP